MDTATCLLVSWSCYRHNCLVSDMCAGPLPHNQTCVMVNMSAVPVAMVPGSWSGEQTCTLAGCNLNRHARWSSATVPSIPVNWVQPFNCNIHYCWCDATNTHDCWPPCDVNDVGYGELVALHDRCSVKLQQICLRTLYYSIKHAYWSIGNQREKLLNGCPFIRHANYHCETYQQRLLHC